MAERHSMTIEQAVREVMESEHADVLRESVRLVVHELMNAEVSGLIGAEFGERSADRATWRNGYRSREWDTRVGVIELQIPKLMSVHQVISLAGIQDKEVSWRCERDDVEVGAVHPAQISHLQVGREEEQGGRRTRIIKLEMQGAELLVFRHLLGPAGGNASSDA